MPKITVKIDQSACILAGNCVALAPQFFQIGQESFAELLDKNGTVHGTEYTFEASEADLRSIEQALDACGPQAISVDKH